MSKQTMIEYLNSRQKDMTEQVVRATGLTCDQVMAILFETGARYIERLAGDPISTAFLKEPLYWAWWKQQWHLMDEAFLHMMPEHLTRDQIRLVYRTFHENIDVYPDPVIWERIHESYQRMSQQVIKKHSEPQKLGKS